MRTRTLIVLSLLALAGLACGLGGQPSAAPAAVPTLIPSPTPPAIPTAIPLTPTPTAGVIEQPTAVVVEETKSAIFAFSSIREGTVGVYFMTAAATEVHRLPLPPELENALWPSLSPDGSRVAFVSVRNNVDLRSNGIFVASLDGSGLTQVTFGDGTHPQWDPTGTGIAFSCETGRNVCLANADGSAVVNLTSGGNGTSSYPSWTPDGRIVFMSTRDIPAGRFASEIYIMNADGSGITRLTDSNEEAYNAYPRVSPDGSQIVFESNRDVPTGSELYVMNIDGSEVRRITEDGVPNMNPVWSPDSARIMYAAQLTDGNIDLYYTDATQQGQPTRLTTFPGEDGGLRFGHSWLRSTVDLVGFIPESTEGVLPAIPEPEGDSRSQSNSIVFAANSFNCADCLETGIYRIDADDRTASTLARLPIEGQYPAWNANFTQVLYVQNGELFVTDRDGQTSVQVTRALMGLSAPIWRNQDEPILANCQPYGQHDACLIDPATGRVRNLTSEIVPGLGNPFPSWAQAEILQGTQVYDLSGNAVRTVLEPGRVSPDGSQLVTVLDGQINLINISTGAVTKLTSDPTTKAYPIWSKDGSRIVFSFAPGDGRLYIGIISADGSNQAVLTPAFAAGPTDPTTPVNIFIGYNWGY